jgi:GNAT superfamily N-acetyltransferase
MIDDQLRIVVRDALLGDAESIVAFNDALARETESKVLDLLVLRRGVETALREPERLRYWVAESEGRVVAMAGVTREWSDWRNTWLWWFQSVYVLPDHRGRGVMSAIFAAIQDAARAEGAGGVRLYVEQQNDRAKTFYEHQGLKPGGYEVYEQIWGWRVVLE